MVKSDLFHCIISVNQLIYFTEPWCNHQLNLIVYQSSLISWCLFLYCTYRMFSCKDTMLFSMNLGTQIKCTSYVLVSIFSPKMIQITLSNKNRIMSGGIFARITCRYSSISTVQKFVWGLNRKSSSSSKLNPSIINSREGTGWTLYSPALTCT